MISGVPDHMGAPGSFTARRPNASHLPSFELPPPQLSRLAQKFAANPHATQPALPPTSLTSVGNLLTPPSNSSADGLSPGSTGVTASNALPIQVAIPPFTPNGSSMWPPSSAAGTTPYGFQPAPTPQAYAQNRSLFSPSLGSLVRSNSTPNTSEGLPPPPFELSQYQAPLSMSTPSLQSVPGSNMMAEQPPASAPVTQTSPVHPQSAYARLPPTPGYYTASQSSSAPQQATFPYSAGPSPVLQSPLSAGGGMPKMSPAHTQGAVQPVPPQQPSPYGVTRPYGYSFPGPVLSNVNNPNGQLALVAGVPAPGMMHSFNSGHAAHMQHLYGHQAHSNPQNDRPFRCDQCPQSFNRNHDLKRHKRIHLAVKPFPCGHCDKSFSRKDALKRHILVKGCGKSQTTAEVREIDEPISPDAKSENMDTSPVVTASA